MRKRTTVLIIVLVLIVLSTVLFRIAINDVFISKELVKAIQSEDYEAVRKITEKSPEAINTLPSIATEGWLSAMNLRSEYPLTEACLTGNLEIIKLLIEEGADISGQNGLTPLSVTYTEKNENWYEISLLLIDKGADLNYKTQYSGKRLSILEDIVQVRPGSDSLGYTPEKSEEVMAAFKYALENCDHSQVEWFLVLRHSVSNDRIEIVKLLLDQGYCDVNDTLGNMTLLMFAARDSDIEMVNLLLGYGADKSIADDSGKTAYDYAIKENKTDVADALSDK